MSTARSAWTNWSRSVQAHPRRVSTPTDVGQVVDAVTRARERGGRVRMVGSGHSFTPIAVAEDALLRPDGLTGVLAVDRETGTVTAAAGTRLDDLNVALAGLGLSLHNMGDIAEQTLAGAVSTGTHGSGGRAAGLAAQLAGFELVSGGAEVLRASRTENTDLFDLGRVGLGALGVLTSLTFEVEPLFLLAAHERVLPWDDVVSDDGLTALTDAHDHLDLYWFPHTDRVQVKTNDRAGTDLSRAEPLGRARAWLDDELLANTVFGLESAALARVPAAAPRANRLNARLLGERRYVDVAHRVFTSRRRVRFREMEYAVPREAAVPALRAARDALDRSRLRIGFPVEVRIAPADDVALSTAHERDTCYLAFHTHVGTDDATHEEYLRVMEAVALDHGGRPHWGKLHTLGADDLAPRYARFEEFRSLRDRLDPDRVLTNAHLERVLGP